MIGYRLVVLAALLWLSTLASASAASWLEMNAWMSGPRYDNIAPDCAAGLGTIATNFATKESRFWNSDLQILNFEGVRETAYRPWAANTIPRRFCSAVAIVSDGTKHKV